MVDNYNNKLQINDKVVFVCNNIGVGLNQKDFNTSIQVGTIVGFTKLKAKVSLKDDRLIEDYKYHGLDHVSKLTSAKMMKI